MSEYAYWGIGQGFALWRQEHLGKDDLMVAVGQDSRLTGPTLAAEGVLVTDNRHGLQACHIYGHGDGRSLFREVHRSHASPPNLSKKTAMPPLFCYY